MKTQEVFVFNVYNDDRDNKRNLSAHLAVLSYFKERRFKVKELLNNKDQRCILVLNDDARVEKNVKFYCEQHKQENYLLSNDERKCAVKYLDGRMEYLEGKLEPVRTGDVMFKELNNSRLYGMKY